MPDGSPWPKISIVTPSFNQAQFLEETIRSVLLQGYPNLEYIIIDGGSTDGSVEIIKKYEPWLANWVSEPDRGQSHAINKGFERSTGEIMAWINSDDVYYPGALSKVAIVLHDIRTVGLLTGAIANTNENSEIINTQEPRINKKTPVDLTLLEPDSWFLPQASSFYLRSSLEKVGVFVREDLHYTMDRELLYRLVHEFEIYIIQDVLASYRHHSESKTTAEVAKSFQETNKSFAYCTWGSQIDKRKREKIKKKRLSVAYYHQGKILPGLSGYFSLINAAILNPDYLKKSNYYKLFIKRLLNRI